jgi:hypothetical protein
MGQAASAGRSYKAAEAAGKAAAAAVTQDLGAVAADAQRGEQHCPGSSTACAVAARLAQEHRGTPACLECSNAAAFGPKIIQLIS